MPSRAVLRKKARRELKRQRLVEAAASGRTSVYYNGNQEGEAPALRRRRTDTCPPGHPSASAADWGVSPSPNAITVPPRFRKPPPPPRQVHKAAKHVALPQPHAEAASSSSVAGAVAEDEGRGSDEVSAVQRTPEDGMTHKQRKKHQARLRLEKQMARLRESAADTDPASASAESVAKAEDGEEGRAPEGRGPALRHDPRFANGTFWRDRKERRARTLFLGGVPAHFTVQHVKDFVSTVVDSDPGATEFIAQLQPGTPLVEGVDMLEAKHGAKVKHMYVTMASVPIAFIASARLDGMRMDQRSLRCNFASDKAQRAEAIRRRSPGA